MSRSVIRLVCDESQPRQRGLTDGVAVSCPCGIKPSSNVHATSGSRFERRSRTCNLSSMVAEVCGYSRLLSLALSSFEEEREGAMLARSEGATRMGVFATPLPGPLLVRGGEGARDQWPRMRISLEMLEGGERLTTSRMVLITSSGSSQGMPCPLFSVMISCPRGIFSTHSL
jgi:hypothetical protein